MIVELKKDAPNTITAHYNFDIQRESLIEDFWKDSKGYARITLPEILSSSHPIYSQHREKPRKVLTGSLHSLVYCKILDSKFIKEFPIMMMKIFYTQMWVFSYLELWISLAYSENRQENGFNFTKVVLRKVFTFLF